MKNPLKNVLLGFLVPFSNFLPDPILKEGNDAYHEQRYEDAYKNYASYMFRFGTTGKSKEKQTADYYIALMGKSSCMMHLDSTIVFTIERALFSEMMDADMNEAQKILLGDILEHSVYWDWCE